MMNDDDDFTDAMDFVQKDEEEGNTDEVDEIDQKIADEHEIFKENQAQRWAQRPGSAPPLSSPRPETIRQREEEKLAAAGTPLPSEDSRLDYVPPEQRVGVPADANSSLSYLMPPRPQSADSAKRPQSADSAKRSQGSLTILKPPAGLQDILEDRPLQETSDGTASVSATPKASADRPSTGKWVVDDEESSEEVEDEGDEKLGASTAYTQDEDEDEDEGIEEGDGPGADEEEEELDSHYSKNKALTQAPPIVVPTGVGSSRADSPDVLPASKECGIDQSLLDDETRVFEDDDDGDDASDALDASHLQSEAGTDFGDVLHPHNFALQLLTHDLRALPEFQHDSEDQAAMHAAEAARASGGASLGQMGYLGISSGPVGAADREDNQAKLVAASAAAIIAASQPPYGGRKGSAAPDRGGLGRPVSAPPVRPWSASPGGKTKSAWGSKGGMAGGGTYARPMSSMPVYRSIQSAHAYDDADSESGQLDTSMSALMAASHMLRQSASMRDHMPPNGGGRPPLAPYSSPPQQSAQHWDTASTSSIGEAGDAVPMLPPSKYSEWHRSTYIGADGGDHVGPSVRGSSARPWTAPGGGARKGSTRPESAHPGITDPAPILRFARPHSAHPTAGFHRKTWDGNSTMAASPITPASDPVRLTAAVAVGGLPVSVYTADTMKRLMQANRWMAAAGSSRRYRLKNPNSNMDIQIYDAAGVTEVDGSTVAPTLRNLSLKQFLTAHARLKGQQQQGATDAEKLEARIRRNSEGAAATDSARWEYRRTSSINNTGGLTASQSRPFSAVARGGVSAAWGLNQNGGGGGGEVVRPASGHVARPTSARPASGGMGSRGMTNHRSLENPYHSSRTYSGREAQAHWDMDDGEDEMVDTGFTGEELGEYDEDQPQWSVNTNRGGRTGGGGDGGGGGGSLSVEQLQKQLVQAAKTCALLAAETSALKNLPME